MKKQKKSSSMNQSANELAGQTLDFITISPKQTVDFLAAAPKVTVGLLAIRGLADATAVLTLFFKMGKRTVTVSKESKNE